MNTHAQDNPSDPDRLIDLILDDPSSPAAAGARAQLAGTPGGRRLLTLDETLRTLPEPADAPDVAPAVMQRLAAESRSVFRPVRAAPSAPAVAAATRAAPSEGGGLRRWWQRLSPVLVPVGLAATAVVLAIAVGSGALGGPVSGAAVGGGGLGWPLLVLVLVALAIWAVARRRG